MKKRNLLITAFTILSLTTIAMAQVPNYIPTNGLVGWWPFNGNAEDESRNGNNGTINGANLTNDRFGNVNKAFSFSSNNHNITINGLYQTGISAYSISGWFKKDIGSDNQSGSLVSGASCSSTPARTGLRAFVGNDNKFYYASESQNCLNTVSTRTTAFGASDGSWHHFVAIFNSPAGSIQPAAFNVFIDGQNVAQNQIAQQPSNLPVSPMNNQALSLIFGNTICNCDYFPGSIDDIAIWNRALSQQEIIDLYNAINCSNNLTISPSTNSLPKGSTATFTATTLDPNPSFVWQSDFGQGYVNLNNYGNYSGTGTNALSISNVQLSEHNQPIRVISTSGSCVDISNIATINITDTCMVTINDTITTLIYVTDTLIIHTNITDLLPPDNLNTVKVFPNPTNDRITIDFGNFASMNGYALNIKNSVGEIVFTTLINQQRSYVDLSTWSGNGIYFVEITDTQNKIIENRKIVLQ